MKAQSSVEYMILIGFVTFGIISILIIAFFYAAIVRDEIRHNQIDIFAKKIISESESVFYSGAPSKRTINAYLPDGVSSIQILSQSIIINYSTKSTVENVREFVSNVNITGTITTSQGVKRLEIIAGDDKTTIS